MPTRLSAQRVVRSAAFYPISGLYVAGVLIALAIAQGLGDYSTGALVYGLLALAAMLLAASRELHAVQRRLTEASHRLDQLGARIAPESPPVAPSEPPAPAVVTVPGARGPRGRRGQPGSPLTRAQSLAIFFLVALVSVALSYRTEVQQRAITTNSLRIAQTQWDTCQAWGSVINRFNAQQDALAQIERNLLKIGTPVARQIARERIKAYEGGRIPEVPVCGERPR